MQSRSQFLLVLLLVSSGAVAHADNWPNWRGPTNNGICRETNIPTRWSRTENVAWKLPLPGPAGATPVIWDDRIFLTSVDDDRLVLICVSTDGRELWRRTVSSGNRNVRGDEGNSAAPSPVTDGEHVWSYMANGALACYDFEGREVWKLDLQDRYGRFKIAFGLTATPVLHGDVLYQQLIHGDGKAATREAVVIALDKMTGREIWKVPRPSDAYAENEHSYASPMLYNFDGRQLLLSHGADYIVAHDLEDGHEVWRCGELNRKGNYDPTLRFVASPACAPGIIVVPTAKRGPLLALRPDSSGDVTYDERAHLWTFDRTPDVPSPLIHDGIVYLCGANGNLNALDQRTGRELYLARTHRQRHRASPVYADGHVYLTARDGRVTVVKTGRQFQLVAENEIDEPVSASPAISNGTLYLRSFENLWAIREQ